MNIIAKRSLRLKYRKPDAYKPLDYKILIYKQWIYNESLMIEKSRVYSPLTIT
jgi:hypothetical protein